MGYFIIKGFLTDSMTPAAGCRHLRRRSADGSCLPRFCRTIQSKVCANGIAAIGNGHDVMGKTLILAAFPELYAILTVAAVFLIAGAI